MAKLKKPPARKPPEKSIASFQYDLFSTFVTNDPAEVSNTIEIWESVPKHFFTPRQMEKLRTPQGHADPYKWEYTYNDQAFTVTIQPALIEQKGGGWKAFFPSVTEELVEEALTKIFADQQFGVHDPDKTESWVRFTLSMVHRELKERGRERNRSQIKHAIQVMARCHLTITRNDEELYSGNILSDLVTVNRRAYMDDRASFHIARLPFFISHSINRLQYRQFNYGRLMQCNEQLSRWLYKRFIHRFRQASLLNDYHFMYSDVAGNSGLLQQGTMQRNRKKLQDALEELVSKSVLSKWASDERKEGRKIVDIKYTVYPTNEFVTEQKAANKRANEHQTRFPDPGMPAVDKLPQGSGSDRRK